LLRGKTLEFKVVNPRASKPRVGHVRRQIRATLLHEVGHYFGLSEEELRGV
jgi:predicted Zn-dependent protease with MMP-like domain